MHPKKINAAIGNYTNSVGTATEMYLYGMQYFYVIIGMMLSAIAMHYIIIPVFHELQITSTYEVLKDKKIELNSFI